MNRTERLAKLKEQERWKEGDGVLGMPKVRVEKPSLKKEEGKG
jgi:small basic protein (TIGR04137 family)